MQKAHPNESYTLFHPRTYPPAKVFDAISIGDHEAKSQTGKPDENRHHQDNAQGHNLVFDEGPEIGGTPSAQAQNQSHQSSHPPGTDKTNHGGPQAWRVMGPGKENCWNLYLVKYSGEMV
jgi:hypothetical protein